MKLYPVKVSFEHNRKNKLNAKGQAPLEMRVYYNGKNKYFALGIMLKPEEWDADKEQVKSRNREHTTYNLTINNLHSVIQEYSHSLQRQGRGIHFDDIGKLIKGDRATSFIDFATEELDRDQTITASTKQTQKHSIELLKEFRPDLQFFELSYEVINDFDRWLSSPKKNLSINTIDKIHRHIKKFCMKAVKMERLEYAKNPYTKFKSRTEETTRIFLIQEELRKLEALTIPEDKPHLEFIRDVFLFSCYTALRYSDAQALTKDNIIETDLGLVLEFKAQKTNKSGSLPLYSLFKNKQGISRPEQIAKKYLHNSSDGKLFKNLSNPHINRELKELAKLAKINKPLTFHSARHTFGTILGPKVPSLILKDLMQHEKIETTEIYMHIAQDLIKKELDKINW